MPTQPSSLASQPWRNSLCRDAGHDWSTTVDTYRRCQREQCRTLQRYEHGHWVTIERHRSLHDPRRPGRTSRALVALLTAGRTSTSPCGQHCIAVSPQKG